MVTKTTEPILTQKQFSKQLGYSDSTFKRYRDNNNMESPYIRKKLKKPLNRKHQFTSSSIQVHATNQHKKNNKNFKKKDLKDGLLLEEQGNKTNYITFARIVVDNIKLNEWDWITDKTRWKHHKWYCWKNAKSIQYKYVNQNKKYYNS